MKRILLALVLASSGCQEVADVDPDSFSTPDVMAFAVNTAFDYSSGSFAIVDLVNSTTITDILPVHSDAVAVCDSGALYIIERFGADTLTVIDSTAPFAIEAQHSLGSGTNPQALVTLDSGDLLITLLDEQYLLAMDPVTGEEIARVDLSWASDADGTPEAHHVIRASGTIAVTLQRLDRDTPMWDPIGPGWIVLIDPDTLIVDTTPIEMRSANPSPYGKVLYRSNLLLVPASGNYGVLDGGIESIDLSSKLSEGLVVTEVDLGGDITDFVIVSDELGWATISTAEMTDALMRFDPTTGSVDPAPVIESSGFTLIGLTLDPLGHLLLVDRALDDPGLRVLDATTGNPIVKISTGMAPFSICVP
jgi:hypothetical protein